MRLRDRAFQTAFACLPVYTILWEDSDVDGRYLGIDENSSVLAIAAAGCGIASLIASSPAAVDAVDINGHHLALTALKVRASMELESHDELYELFGYGRHPHPRRIVDRLCATMPPWIRRYWKCRSGLFRDSLYRSGLTARMFGLSRRLTGVGEPWLRALARMPIEDRLVEIDGLFRQVLERATVRKAVESPLQLVTLGVNFSQRDRLLATSESEGLASYMLEHFERVARTDLDRNWFAWQAVAGSFNHDSYDAVPPYLRPDRHDRSRRAHTRVSFHRESIFDRLARAGSATWSHFLLCDAIDWMPERLQRRLFDEIHRTAKDGAMVLYRSVEDVSLVARHGLERRFMLLGAESEQATVDDRTRQYRRVNFYRVAK